MRRSGQSVAAQLRKQGHNITVYGVSDGDQVIRYLNDLWWERRKAPDMFLLDVVGVGADAAKEILDWYKKWQPGARQPVIGFASTAMAFSVMECANFLKEDGRLQPVFVDTEEIQAAADFLNGDLDSQLLTSNPPASTAFRQFLNDRLGTQLSLIYNEKLVANFKAETNRTATAQFIVALKNGSKLSEATIEWVRGYALGLSRSLMSGFCKTATESGPDLEPEAVFYCGTGFPCRGTAVFSLDAVKNFSGKSGALPVLVMQGYDPAVVPLLAGGKLGGLIVTSTYMASHLKLLCETYMVPGLFGLKSAGGDSLKDVFDEESRPDFPAYFEGKRTMLAGNLVEEGQDVLLGYGRNGALFHPRKILDVTTQNVGMRQTLSGETLDGLANLGVINRALTEFLQARGIASGWVKANINAAMPAVLEHAADIGLVRTEQLAGASEAQMEALKSFWLEGDEKACETAGRLAQTDYETVFQKLKDGNRVRIRMYDFVQREILDPQGRSRFLAKYGASDIRGGEALAQWPQLYRMQLAAIFKAFRKTEGKKSPPLEIMMPAVKTLADVQAARRVVEDAAKAAGISADKYKFGVMVETLQACENIRAIAPCCDFISFGTNDLTQDYFGVSRTDLKEHEKIKAETGCNPFETMSPEIFDLVGKVTAQARQARPGIEISVCGAQAQDADTAARLFNEAGVDSISVNPTPGNMYGLAVAIAYSAYDMFGKKPATPATALAPAL